MRKPRGFTEYEFRIWISEPYPEQMHRVEVEFMNFGFCPFGGVLSGVKEANVVIFEFEVIYEHQRSQM